MGGKVHTLRLANRQQVGLDVDDVDLFLGMSRRAARARLGQIRVIHEVARAKNNQKTRNARDASHGVLLVRRP